MNEAIIPLSQDLMATLEEERSKHRQCLQAHAIAYLAGRSKLHESAGLSEVDAVLKYLGDTDSVTDLRASLLGSGYSEDVVAATELAVEERVRKQLCDYLRYTHKYPEELAEAIVERLYDRDEVSS